jgi:hypothetical protein
VEIETEYQGQRVTGLYAIEDKDFAERLCQRLNADCIGKTIREIGEMDIDF